MNVYLKVPELSQLSYRKAWMSDKQTMNYNKGYDLGLSGYNIEEGTIIKSDEELEEWYGRWVNKEPDRYYAYIYVNDVKEPIGEIYYYPDNDIHRVGILIDFKYRGFGYSVPVLKELFKVAFDKNNISELYDYFPIDRVSAIKSFENANFIRTGRSQIIKYFNTTIESVELLITREMYEKTK